MGDERESAQKAAQKAAEQSELHKAVNHVALQARARKLEAGDIIKMGGCKLVVDEDTLGLSLKSNVQ